MNSAEKKGLIFDLDGTLWDACDAIAVSWNIYMKEHYPEYEIDLSEEDLRRACGLTMKAIGDLLYPQIPEPTRWEATDGCCVYEVEYLKTAGGKVYEGVVDMLRALSSDYHLYIVSNCQVGYIEDFLSWSGADAYIEDFENFGRTGMQKDANIRLLVQRNELKKALYIGDTQGDMDAAGAAGIPFLHARYGFGSVDPSVPYIDDIRELPDALKGLEF